MKLSNMNSVTIEFTADEILLLDKLTSIAIEYDHQKFRPSEENLFMEMTKKFVRLADLIRVIREQNKNE